MSLRKGNMMRFVRECSWPPCGWRGMTAEPYCPSCGRKLKKADEASEEKAA